jgi:REP element-mobilizing transposase RayT
MKVLFERPIKLQKVITKKGVELWKIELSPDHFFLEQNPFKNSKYGRAYRMLKEKYPAFYMFWEIENNQYTGRLLMGTIVEKSDIDALITDLLRSEEYKNYEDIREEIEPME